MILNKDYGGLNKKGMLYPYVVANPYAVGMHQAARLYI